MMPQEEDDTIATSRQRGKLSGPHITQQPLFSKLRTFNHLALSSVGSFFTSISSSKSSNEGNDSASDGGSTGQDLDTTQQSTTLGLTDSCIAQTENDNTPHASDCHTLGQDGYWNHQFTTSPDNNVPFNGMQSSTKSPHKAHISTFLSESQHSFGGLSRMRHLFDKNDDFCDFDGASNSITVPAMNSAPLASIAMFPSSVPSLDGSFFSTPSESYSIPQTHVRSGDSETPPLTPDLAGKNFGPLLEPSLSALCSSRFSSRFTILDASENIAEDVEDGAIYSSPYLYEIKEGKKPERINDVDQDIHCDHNSEALVATEGPDEWYGLEYTLEMSSRERQPLELQSQSISGGEHSRSRESWAAIRRGAVHPVYEDEDYHRWKNWHRYLDRQAERKRHKRGYEFKSRSKQLAWLYVDEIRTRDIMYWQKEVFGVVARDVKDRLQYLVELRPDPFFPPQKHDWSWCLKRSISVACVQELKMKSNF